MHRNPLHQPVRQAIRPVNLLAAALALAVLAGCGSTPRRESGGIASPSPRSGGYYLDDGPGDAPPPNLDAVPDAVPRAEPLHRGASRPYTVMGRSYTPMTALAPYRARGIASWYGRRYHGKQTSSGEIYDMYAMTAAHTTLPIPSYARVTNPANGRSVVVRVNDRGPFIDGRLIDLSYTAAYKLGILAGGSGLVDVESIIPGADPATAGAAQPAPPAGPRDGTPVAVREPEPVVTAPLPPAGVSALQAASVPAAPVGASAGGYFLQLGAFGSRENAEGFLERLRKQVDWLADRLHLQQGDGLFRIRAGPYSGAPEARLAADRIAQALGIKAVLQAR